MSTTLNGPGSAVAGATPLSAADLGDLITRLSARAAYATGEEYAEIRTLMTALNALLSTKP